MSDELVPGRKINLDTSVYCPYTMRSTGGRKDCGHDFDDSPSEQDDEIAVYICTRCGMRVTYEVWD